MKPRRLLPLAFLAITAPLLFAQQQGGGRIIYDVKSPFSRIVVYDTANGYRQMIFDPRFDGTDAIQSEMNKTTGKRNELTLAYARYMITTLPALEKTPKHILIIGLGGGCLQRYLYDLLPQAIIETAELDPAVLQVAQQYFGFLSDDRQKVSIGDGRKFIEQSHDKYDLIILDAFSATSIPYLLATREFLTTCKDHLADGGAVAANLWYDQADYHDMLKTYNDVFAEWHLMRCPNCTNAILLAFPEKRNLTPEKWMDQCNAFEKAHPTGLKLADMVDKEIEQVTRVPVSAKILRDADAASHN